jgi:UDP-2-acetamido-2-deoxy-ribo-hexuluronate aminotransferase
LTPQDTESTYHLFVIQVKKREQFRDFLKKHSIGTGVYYPYPIHKQPFYSADSQRAQTFPYAERFAKELVALPMYPDLTEKEVCYVTRSIKEFFNK